MIDQSIGMRSFDTFKVKVTNMDVTRPLIDNSFKLLEGEEPLSIGLSEVTDSGDVVLQANKDLQPVEDFSVFTGRTEAFEFSILKEGENEE